MKKLLFLSVFATLAFSGCYYDKEDELYYYYNQMHQCQADSLTYVANIEPIVNARCAITGCHVSGGTGNGIFENYSGVKEKVDNGSLMDRVVVRKDMPDSDPLNECQISQFEAWINAGAPEN